MRTSKHSEKNLLIFAIALVCGGRAMADETIVAPPVAPGVEPQSVAPNGNDARGDLTEELAAAIASPSQNLAPVKALIGAGADVNALTPKGHNLLMVAITNDNYPAVWQLLAAGARPDLSTELFMASIEGDTRRVRAALDQGAKVDSEDYDGGTPLIFAVSRKRIDVVQLLIERGADVNHRNQEGWTALMYAANYIEPLSAQLLLQHGANIYLKSKSGKTAIDEMLIYNSNSSHLFPYERRNLQTLRLLFRSAINARTTKV